MAIPTMAEMDAARRSDFSAMQKALSKGESRLDAKEQKVRNADTAWEACKKAVDLRDGMKCRICKHKTERTIELKGNRHEHAHIVRRRKEKALLTDPRNVLVLCKRDHDRLDHHEIVAVQKDADKFELNGRRFINADKPSVKFVPWTPKKAAGKD